jgi:putative GTP pyrophosphokinase
MILEIGDIPPWGTKGRLNNVGKKIRLNQELLPEENEAFDSWRGAHSYVLNTFKPLLWSRVRNKDIVVAQRLKRRSTIFDKLHREPKMELARMDDIAGCRLIFKNPSALDKFRAEFHKGKFNHKLRHEDPEKYNYIDRPKPSGYRGVHEVYVYNVSSTNGKKFNGLYVEMQFRTVFQHAWATAVEVVGRLTENQPKFNKGDERHIEFFRIASEIIARSKENARGPLPGLSDSDVCNTFRKLDDEINIMRILNSVSIIKQTSNIKNNIVLQLSRTGKLIVHKYANIDSATNGYFALEKTNPDDDIVLVRAKTFDDIQSAYRNYFQNTDDFVRYVSDGLKLLEKRGENE